MILTPLIDGRFSRPFRMLAVVLLIAGQLAGAGHVHAHEGQHDHHIHGQEAHGHDTHDDAAPCHETPSHEERHHNCDICRLTGRHHEAVLPHAPFYRVPVTTVYTLHAVSDVALVTIEKPVAYQGRAPPLT